jgi:hypothetical protein
MQHEMQHEESDSIIIRKYSWWLLLAYITYNLVNFVLICWMIDVFRMSGTNQLTLVITWCWLLLLLVSMYSCFKRSSSHNHYLVLSVSIATTKLFLFTLTLYCYTNALIPFDHIVVQGIAFAAHIMYDIIVGLMHNTGYEYDLQPYLPYEHRVDGGNYFL